MEYFTFFVFTLSTRNPVCILYLEHIVISLWLVATLLASKSLEGSNNGFDTECGIERISDKRKHDCCLTLTHLYS